MNTRGVATLLAAASVIYLSATARIEAQKPPEPPKPKEGIVGTYRVMVPDLDFATTRKRDEAEKPQVMSAQRALLEERYDLSSRPSPVKMSGGRKAVQEGVRVKLSGGTTRACPPRRHGSTARWPRRGPVPAFRHR